MLTPKMRFRCDIMIPRDESATKNATKNATENATKTTRKITRKTATVIYIVVPKPDAAIVKYLSRNWLRY